MLVNEAYYVKTEEKEHTVKIQNEDEKFYSYDAELVENPTGTLVEKTITENGEYLPASDNADGYSKVTVSVPSSGLPTLFAPIIIGGYNKIAWQHNPQNGGFAVTFEASVDGNAVSSPLTITQEMSGKTLIIISSAPNFQSQTTQITLSYLTTKSFATVDENALLPTGCQLRAEQPGGGFYWNDGQSRVGEFGTCLSILFSTVRTLETAYYLEITGYTNVALYRRVDKTAPDEMKISSNYGTFPSYFRSGANATLKNIATGTEYTASITNNEVYFNNGAILPDGIYMLIVNVT